MNNDTTISLTHHNIMC